MTTTPASPEEYRTKVEYEVNGEVHQKFYVPVTESEIVEGNLMLTLTGGRRVVYAAGSWISAYATPLPL